MKWGLFGGTFDPIHLGHLRCAQEILEILALDRVCFVPSCRPPLKALPEVSPFEHRLRMVHAAIAGNPGFEADDIEARRKGKSYSIDTVRELLAKRGPELFFILGQDAFDDIRKWKAWEEFLTLCHFVVMTRPGYSDGGLERAFPPEISSRFRNLPGRGDYAGPGGKSILFRKVTYLDISSSDIRERIRAGKSIRYLVPDPVRDYIKSRKLYST